MRKHIITLTAILAVFISTTAFSADVLHSVYVNGLAQTGSTVLQPNTSYPITLPAIITTETKSSLSALLPNGHGLFMGETSVMTLEIFSRENTPTGQSWIGLVRITVPRGSFAMCAPEKSATSGATIVTTRGTVILSGEQSTYSVLGDQLTVTRGSVNVNKTSTPKNHVIVQAGESILLTDGPIVIMSAKQSGGMSVAVTAATIEACSARLAVPSSVAGPTAPTKTAFPIQPINPDLVSPSS